MVEYALLLAHNTSSLLTVAGTDVVAWASGLNWARIALAFVGLVTLRMGIWAFKGR
jgi:hypothetical protein